jgi:hypothetical protein
LGQSKSDKMRPKTKSIRPSSLLKKNSDKTVSQYSYLVYNNTVFSKACPRCC